MDRKVFSLPPSGFIRLPQVLSLIPVCKSSWWQGCKSGRFPRPVKLGPRTTAWKVEDIRNLIKQMGQDDVSDSPDGHAA